MGNIYVEKLISTVVNFSDASTWKMLCWNGKLQIVRRIQVAHQDVSVEKKT